MSKKHTVLSLFSCCGGLDLGLEGNFSVFARQIDENKTKDWIEKALDDGKVLLKENDFETIFANDIDKNARVAWINFFQSKEKRNNADYI